MRKFVQICASQNNLFALDEEGDIYQYHFNVETWVKLALICGQHDDDRPADVRRVATAAESSH